MIEEETGSPLEIAVSFPDVRRASLAEASAEAGGAAGEAKLIARDERKNPLISTFEWTSDAVQRVFRVPVGFMRSKTQERIEALAAERAAATIDLALVEEGIEIGKKMMAEMIATYNAPQPAATKPAVPATPASAEPGNGDYLNEVRSR